MTPSTSIVLYTPNLMLRPFRRRDVGQLHEAVVVSHRELEAYLPWAHGYTRPVAAQFIRDSTGAWHDGRAYDFAIRRDVDPNRHVGNASIWYVSKASLVGEIGYWVRSDETRSGVCTESTARLLRFGFEDLGLHRITLRIGIGNRGSERIAEKLGFTREGVLRDEVRVGARWIDHSVWGLLEPEWRSELTRYRDEAWI